MNFIKIAQAQTRKKSGKHIEGSWNRLKIEFTDVGTNFTVDQFPQKCLIKQCMKFPSTLYT